MALFGKLNSVMNAKRVANQPLTEEQRAPLETAIIFDGKTKTIVEEVQATNTRTKAEELEESVISDISRFSKLKAELLAIKENY